MLGDESREDDHGAIEERLLRLVNGGLEYFLALSGELHREGWTPVLLLVFSRVLLLSEVKVNTSIPWVFW